MNDTEEIKVLLGKILEVQQAHYAEYQRLAEQTLANQASSIAQQTRAVRMQRIGLGVLLAFIGLGRFSSLPASRRRISTSRSLRRRGGHLPAPLRESGQCG